MSSLLASCTRFVGRQFCPPNKLRTFNNPNILRTFSNPKTLLRPLSITSVSHTQPAVKELPFIFKSEDIKVLGIFEQLEKMVKRTAVVSRRPRTRSQCEEDEKVATAKTEALEKSIQDGDYANFDISKKMTKKLISAGIEYLFPTQALTYKEVHAGKDVIVQARTGTGKTLAFALPLLQKLYKTETPDQFTVKQRSPIILTLAPTRELAVQISKEYEKFKPKKVSVACFYGGSPYAPQENQLWEGIDILVGTPGRILDHLNRGNVDFSKLEHVVLDEADRMMDMGFQESLDQILEQAYTNDNKPQTLLFSATVPPWVKQTAKKYMNDGTKVLDLIGTEINKSSVTVEHKAIKCPYWDRASVIKDVIQVYSGKHGKTIIFASTKKEANELSLSSVINMESQVLHGDIQQQQREITLKSFRDGKFNCLIATDVAARGLDIPEVDLVVQTEPPKDVDSYIHRAGRTGRAGRNGVCVIFYKPGTEHSLRAVEQRAGIKFTRIGAPQQADILQSSADDAVKSLDLVKESVTQIFIPAAQKLIEERGAEQALAAALAFISGTVEMSSRSLLSSQAGFTTYMMKQNLELRGTGLIWNILKRHFDPEITDNIKGMRMCKDKVSCVFDIREVDVEKVEEAWKGDRFATLEAITELPELVENFDANSWGQNRNGGYQRGGGGGGFNNNRGFNSNRGSGGYNNSYGRGGSWNNRGASNENGWTNGFNGKRKNNDDNFNGNFKKFKN